LVIEEAEMPEKGDLLTRESGLAKRQRATPLKPAVWMTGVLVWATVVGLILRVPTWGAVFLCCLSGASFLFYLLSYIYLMVVDRDSLRSERYQESLVAHEPGVASPRGALAGRSRGTTVEEENREVIRSNV